MYDLQGMYEITPYTRRRAKELGLQIKPSENKKKKLDVFKDGQKVASIGAVGYLDYPTYIKKFGPVVARNRRKAYKIRHAKDRRRRGTPGYYADQLLW